MMELLKKHGIPAGMATLIVLAITFVPCYYQYKYTKEQNARITALEAQVASLKK
jgi:hypothetical protein